jgi:hypothetical protein
MPPPQSIDEAIASMGLIKAPAAPQGLPLSKAYPTDYISRFLEGFMDPTSNDPRPDARNGVPEFLGSIGGATFGAGAGMKLGSMAAGAGRNLVSKAMGQAAKIKPATVVDGASSGMSRLGSFLAGAPKPMAPPKAPPLNPLGDAIAVLDNPLYMPPVPPKFVPKPGPDDAAFERMGWQPRDPLRAEMQPMGGDGFNPENPINMAELGLPKGPQLRLPAAPDTSGLLSQAGARAKFNLPATEQRLPMPQGITDPSRLLEAATEPMHRYRVAEKLGVNANFPPRIGGETTQWGSIGSAAPQVKNNYHIPALDKVQQNRGWEELVQRLQTGRANMTMPQQTAYEALAARLGGGR